MRSKGYKCYNYHCGGRVGDSPLCGETGDASLYCQDRIVSTKTNADRIRAMSDEELAEHICRKFECPRGKDYVACEYVGECKDCWLDWLQQPAKEDYHEL